MTAQTGNEPGPPQNGAHLTRRQSCQTARLARAPYPSYALGNGEEAGFWAQLEEREFGRLALEADHLFDTSYQWAP